MMSENEWYIFNFIKIETAASQIRSVFLVVASEECLINYMKHVCVTVLQGYDYMICELTEWSFTPCADWSYDDLPE